MNDLVKRLLDVGPKDSGYAEIAREAAARIHNLEQALHRIAGGSDDDKPPFRALSAEMLRQAARQALVYEG
jgi:hypothetical protein